MTDPRRVPREPAAFEGEERIKEEERERGRKGKGRDAPRRKEGIHLCLLLWSGGGDHVTGM